MRRRALLSLGALSLAGCVDSPGDGTEAPTDSPTQTTTDPTTPTSTATATGTPPDVGVPPADSDCPTSEAATRVVCVPETDPESVPIALTADSLSGSLPTTFTFALTNGSDATLSINFYDWSLWKRVDGEWHHIVPEAVQEPLMRLGPGASHEWELTAEHEQPANPSSYYLSWESSGTVGGLGGGEYAFTIDGWWADGSYEQTTAFGLLLQFDAPDLELEPTAAVTGSSRDGDIVTVRGEGSDSEDARKAEFVLERVAEASDPRTLIPEQAVHDSRLRNTLPYFEDGVETVRYVADDATWPVFGVDKPFSIRYEGELFEASASVLETETETA